MDGQRRVDQQMKNQTPTYSRTRNFSRIGFLAIGNTWQTRILARSSAVLLLALTILHSILQGGYLNYEGSPWLKIPGKLSSIIGMAADDIRIKGLVHQDAEAVLASLGIKPGYSLVGFDAAHAKRLLENQDWVASAKVQRLFPNQLEIALVERVPFAVWQRVGNYYVIDRFGSAMSNVNLGQLSDLPLVTGEGAQTAAAELVNHLEVNPDLLLKTKAAARVGQRRWNLYLDNGIIVQLPENNVEAALARLATLEHSQHLLSKGVKNIDLRFSGRVIVGIAGIKDATDGAVKISQSE